MESKAKNTIAKYSEVKMRKQTAVEWLKKQLEDYGEPNKLVIIWEELDSLVDQAKAMEKEQIESSYTKGREQWQKYEWDSSQSDDVKFPTPRNYYNETYKGGQDGI